MKQSKKVCVVCGKQFTGHKVAKYCSEKCRRYRPPKFSSRTCKKCGKDFMARYTQGYCYDCLHDKSGYMSKLLRARKDNDWENVRKCKYCGDEFEPVCSSHRYCCRECRDAYNRMIRVAEVK